MPRTLRIGSKVGNPEGIDLGISQEATRASRAGLPGLRPETLRGGKRRGSKGAWEPFSDPSVKWGSSREQDRPGP